MLSFLEASCCSLLRKPVSPQIKALLPFNAFQTSSGSSCGYYD